jgi:hypothetical protein
LLGGLKVGCGISGIGGSEVCIIRSTGVRSTGNTAAAATAAPAEAATRLTQLQSEIDLGGRRADLHLATVGLEAEHVDVHGPRPGGHLIERERPVGVSRGNENSIALGGAHCGAGDRLAIGLNGSRLAPR